MNTLKKYLGVVWMALAPLLVLLMSCQAVDKISHAAAASRSNTILQWVIILLIFIPICAGFFVFGYYAYRGAYEHLPESSGELGDD